MLELYLERRALYKDNVVVSEKMKIDIELISLWLLHRIEIPKLKNTEDLKKFITGVNLLIEPVSGGVYGPVGFFYDNDLTPIEPKGSIIISTKNQENLDLLIDKYNIWDDNQPSGNKRLREILQEEKKEVLNTNSYSSYSADKNNINGSFTFSNLYVDYLVPFLSLHHIDKQGKSQIDWYDLKTKEKIEILDDIDDYWCFSN